MGRVRDVSFPFCVAQTMEVNASKTCAEVGEILSGRNPPFITM